MKKNQIDCILTMCSRWEKIEMRGNTFKGNLNLKDIEIKQQLYFGIKDSDKNTFSYSLEGRIPILFDGAVFAKNCSLHDFELWNIAYKGLSTEEIQRLIKQALANAAELPAEWAHLKKER